MARAIMHPESQRDATAATAATGKGITHREPQPGIRIIVLLRVRKVETASRQFARSPKYSGSYYVPRDQSATGFARKPGIQQRAGTTAKGATRPDRAWSRQNAANRQRLDPQTKQRLRNWQGRAPGYADAKRNHHEHWQDRHHHDHDWWRHHCDAIVFVGGGFWGWYDGWWYPAWGYDPYYSDYDYNGPIYGYDGLQPDEVIANVQAALQQLGYYPYAGGWSVGSCD